MDSETIWKIAETLRILEERLTKVEESHTQLMRMVRHVEAAVGNQDYLANCLEVRVDRELAVLHNALDDVYVMLDPVLDRVMPHQEGFKQELDAILARRRPSSGKST